MHSSLREKMLQAIETPVDHLYIRNSRVWPISFINYRYWSESKSLYWMSVSKVYLITKIKIFHSKGAIFLQSYCDCIDCAFKNIPVNCIEFIRECGGYYRAAVAWEPATLSPAHNIWDREVRSGIAPLGRNYLRTENCSDQSNCQGGLYTMMDRWSTVT